MNMYILTCTILLYGRTNNILDYHNILSLFYNVITCLNCPLHTCYAYFDKMLCTKCLNLTVYFLQVFSGQENIVEMCCTHEYNIHTCGACMIYLFIIELVKNDQPHHHLEVAVIVDVFTSSQVFGATRHTSR